MVKQIDGQIKEAVDDADEVAVTMRKGDWRVVEEFFVSMTYEDDYGEDGNLIDERLARIRQKLAVAAK